MKTALASQRIQQCSASEAQYVAPQTSRVPTAVVANPDPVSRSFHSDCLSEMGIRVTEAADGRGVLDAADRGELDVAVVSLFMPEVDGIETVRYLHRRHPQVRIVVVVNNSHPAFLELGRVASLLGAHQVLYEPFTTSRLAQAASRLMARRAGRA